MKKYIEVFEIKDFKTIPEIGEYFRVGWSLGYCILKIFGYVIMFNKEGIKRT